MGQAPLVIDEIEAGKAFIERMNSYSPVAGAAWIRPDEDGERYLYVVLSNLADENTDAAYMDVWRVVNELKDQHYVDPFRVRVIGPNDPFARGITEIYRRYPGRIPSGYNGSDFPGQAVVDAYIYPRIVSKAAPVPPR